MSAHVEIALDPCGPCPYGFRAAATRGRWPGLRSAAIDHLVPSHLRGEHQLDTVELLHGESASVPIEVADELEREHPGTFRRLAGPARPASIVRIRLSPTQTGTLVHDDLAASFPRYRSSPIGRRLELPAGEALDVEADLADVLDRIYPGALERVPPPRPARDLEHPELAAAGSAWSHT